MGNANTVLTIRVSEEDKAQASDILESLGTNLSAAVNMLLKQIIIQNGIPFLVINKPVKTGITDRLYGAIKDSEMTLDKIKEERLAKYETAD